MKKLSLLLLLATFAFYGCNNNDDKDDKDNKDDVKTYVLSLPSYETHTLDLGDSEHPLYSWETRYTDPETNTIYVTNYYQNLLIDNNKLFEFDCFASKEYGFGSNSFAFTNCSTNNCDDFKNYDYRAIPKKGVNNNTYVIVGADGYQVGENYDLTPSIRFKDNENPKKVDDYLVKGLYVTNCVYAYNSMKDGSPIFGGQDKFDSKDSFKVIIYNMDKSKKVESYLAEGTSFITTWKWIDLTSLGETEGLKFELKTTKINEYGPMTPTYFCLDGITLIED